MYKLISLFSLESLRSTLNVFLPLVEKVVDISFQKCVVFVTLYANSIIL